MKSWLVFGVVLVGASSAGAASTTDLCVAAKLTAAAKYAQCRLKADADYEKRGDETRRDIARLRCTGTLAKSYAAAEKRYPGACPTTEDAFDVLSFLASCSDQTTVGALGGAIPGSGFCGPNTSFDVSGRLCTAPDPTALCGAGTVYDPGTATCVGTPTTSTTSTTTTTSVTETTGTLLTTSTTESTTTTFVTQTTGTLPPTSTTTTFPCFISAPMCNGECYFPGQVCMDVGNGSCECVTL